MDYSTNTNRNGPSLFDHIMLWFLCFHRYPYDKSKVSLHKAGKNWYFRSLGSLGRFATSELMSRFIYCYFMLFGIPIMIFASLTYMILYSFPVGLLLLLVSIFAIWRVVDWKSLESRKAYFRSVWWNNTGVRPGALLFDEGLRGEYEATETIEKALEAKHVYGKVFNRVLIPKFSHGEATYTEADIVVVSTNGIHVFESKNINGYISGVATSENWSVDYPSGSRAVIRNPFLQNQGHINYLAEYLYENLRGEDLCPEAPFICCFANNVMFHRATYLRLNPLGEPFLFCDYSLSNTDAPYGYYSVMSTVSEHLTMQQVSRICELIKPLADHSPEEYQRIMEMKIERERIEQRNRELNPGDSRYQPAQYCAVRFDTGLACVLRSNGDYMTADCFRDGLFRALPEMKNWRVLDWSDWKPGERGLAEARQLATAWTA